MSHVWHPRRYTVEDPRQLDSNEPLLFDGCTDCERLVNPVFQSPTMSRALWAKMVRVDFQLTGGYRSDTEAKAGSRLYEAALFLQRAFGLEPTENGFLRPPLQA